jgi:hypothetical protein
VVLMAAPGWGDYPGMVTLRRLIPGDG